MIHGRDWLRASLGTGVLTCCVGVLGAQAAQGPLTGAQTGSRQVLSTGPRGSQLVEEFGPPNATAGGGASLASAVAAGPRWAFVSGNENWIGRYVSLGDFGTQVFTELGSAYPTRLFSSHDQNPPTPLWTAPLGPLKFNHRVASAEEADLHLSLYHVDVGGGMRRIEVQRFGSAGPGPIFVHPVQVNGHDAAGVRIARDGRKAVVAVYDVFTARTIATVIDTATMTSLGTRSLQTSGAFRAFEISEDARLIYLASNTAIRIFDLVTDSQLLNSYPPGGTIFNSHGISGDGRWAAYGGYGKIRVFQRDVTGSFQLAFEHLHPGANFCDQLAFSADGSTLAAGFNFYEQYLRVDVVALDLTTRAVTLHDPIAGGGSLQNVIADLDLSRDGSTIAAGLWGDEQGHVAEVRVYRRNQSQPIAAWNLPGSVMALDLSPDGKRLAVAAKAVHAAQFGSGGSIEVFDTRAVDFDLSGLPRPGATMRFELRGTPGASAYLLVAEQQALRPLEFGGVGTLYLKRSALELVYAGVADSQGRAFVSFVLPPGSSGREYFFQGYSTPPRRLSQDWTKLTVGPAVGP